MEAYEKLAVITAARGVSVLVSHEIELRPVDPSTRPPNRRDVHFAIDYILEPVRPSWELVTAARLTQNQPRSSGILSRQPLRLLGHTHDEVNARHPARRRGAAPRRLAMSNVRVLPRRALRTTASPALPSWRPSLCGSARRKTAVSKTCPRSRSCERQRARSLTRWARCFGGPKPSLPSPTSGRRISSHKRGRNM